MSAEQTSTRTRRGAGGGSSFCTVITWQSLWRFSRTGRQILAQAQAMGHPLPLSLPLPLPLQVGMEPNSLQVGMESSPVQVGTRTMTRTMMMIPPA